MTDVVSQIIAGAAAVAANLWTAEGRCELDAWLRAQLAVLPQPLRGHAGELIRQWRWEQFRLAEIEFRRRHSIDGPALDLWSAGEVLIDDEDFD